MDTMVKGPYAGIIAQLITVKGVVQGVGFRPFVYRLAHEMGVKGFITNTSDGVLIHAEGEADILERFCLALRQRMPALADIKSICAEPDDYKGFADFSIASSISSDGGYTMVPPDMSVCDDCLKEMFDKSDRRYHYPFINCINCGPRYSIIKDIPYDRPNTTMASFEMCRACHDEYTQPRDRRFHAQPIACPDCGPSLSFYDGQNFYTGDEECIRKCAEALSSGKIAAVKGIGGFHLMVDARKADAVKRLRARKNRDYKPFALMMRDLNMIKLYCDVDEAEERLLTSMRRPIVLLKKKMPCFETAAPGVDTLGVMLPYAPLHYLLFEYVDFPLIATSANLSGQPMIKDNQAALAALRDIADVFLLHNRDIYIAVDDSVVAAVDGQTSMVRRARGYVPEPMPMPFASRGVLACGGQQKVTVCLAHDGYAFLSQHIGDLDDYNAYGVYIKTIEHLQRLFRTDVVLMAHDMHPQYRSTVYAQAVGGHTLAVQHHHAHIASCMVENNIKDLVIGVCFDGTGYGTDGHIWGGEFMIADYCGFKRMAHLAYAAMAGSDAAVKEPNRMAMGYIYGLGGDCAFRDQPGALSDILNMPVEKIKAISAMLDKRFNVAFTSSMGRLFDAMSSIAGIRHTNHYDAQAAIELECAAVRDAGGAYEFNIDQASTPMVIDWRPVIKAALEDRQGGVPPGIISMKFHNAVVDMIVKVCSLIHQRTGLKSVVLSGGAFQNRYINSAARRKLMDLGLDVYTHKLVPCNDGGLALGQAAVAEALLAKENGHVPCHTI